MTSPKVPVFAGIIIVVATVGVVLVVLLFARMRARRATSSTAKARAQAETRKRAIEEEARRQAAAAQREAMLAQLAARREALAKRRAEAPRGAPLTVPAESLPQAPSLPEALTRHQVSMPESAQPRDAGIRHSSVVGPSRISIRADEAPSAAENGQGSQSTSSVPTSETSSEVAAKSDGLRILGSESAEPDESSLALDTQPAVGRLGSVPNELGREASTAQSSEVNAEAAPAKTKGGGPEVFAVEPCKAPPPVGIHPAITHSVPEPSEQRESVCFVQVPETGAELDSTNANVQTPEVAEAEVGDSESTVETPPVGVSGPVAITDSPPPRSAASDTIDNAVALATPGQPTDRETASNVAEVAGEMESPADGGPTNLASNPEGMAAALPQGTHAGVEASSLMRGDSHDSPREPADAVSAAEPKALADVVSGDSIETQRNEVRLFPESDSTSGETEPTTDDLQQLSDVAASAQEDDTAAPKQRRYRMLSRNPAQARPPPRQVPSRTVDRGAPVDVRLSFGRDGRCAISLVPRRTDAMPPTVTVSRRGHDLELIEMQEGWYEDVFIEDLGAELKSGVFWEGRSQVGDKFRWSLGGRDVFVLAAHSQLSGFVDTNRLELNERHVVLCTEEMEPAVQAILTSAGVVGTTQFTSQQGAPRGWIALRNVIPRRVVEPPEVADRLDCLRPVADAELTLEGGVRLQGNTWLAGFPPSIRIRGDALMVGEVRIDGKVAIQNNSSAFQSEDWDTLGSHFVACSVGTATYILVEPERDWRAWPAHNWTLGEDEAAAKLADRPSVCGALVMPPAARSTTSASVVVPLTNSVVLGALPGEMEVCKPMHDRTSKHCVGFPAFRPVWALPLDAMHCKKKTSGVIFLAPSLIPAPSRADARRTPLHGGVLAWCNAILSASRKGLVPTSGDPAVAALWASYRDTARLLRRRLR